MDASTPASQLADMLTNVGTCFTSVTGMITANWIAMVFVGFSIAGAGVGLWKHITSRRR